MKQLVQTYYDHINEANIGQRFDKMSGKKSLGGEVTDLTSQYKALLGRYKVPFNDKDITQYLLGVIFNLIITGVIDKKRGSTIMGLLLNKSYFKVLNFIKLKSNDQQLIERAYFLRTLIKNNPDTFKSSDTDEESTDIEDGENIYSKGESSSKVHNLIGTLLANLNSDNDLM